MSTSENHVLEALQTLHELTVKWKWDPWAEMIQRLIDLYRAGSPQFGDELASVDLWGGAGALWESNPRYYAKATHQDELQFRQAFITLAKYMYDNKLGSQRIRDHARSIASAFEEWTAEGL